MTPRPYIPLIAVRCTDASESYHLRTGQVYHATFDQPPAHGFSGTLRVRIEKKGKTLFKVYPRTMFTPCNPDRLNCFPISTAGQREHLSAA